MSLMYDIYNDDAIDVVDADRGNHVVTAPLGVVVFDEVTPAMAPKGWRDAGYPVPQHGPTTSDGRCVYCGEHPR